MKVENGVLLKVEPGDIVNGSFDSWEGITRIDKLAFRDCTSLESIVLSTSITELEEGAFSFCKNLKSIVLPPSITKI